MAAKINVEEGKRYEVSIQDKGTFIFRSLGSGKILYTSFMARSPGSTEVWIGDALPDGVKLQLEGGNLEEDGVVILDIRLSETQDTAN
ncbi:hypothetical protein VTK56DRAFT_4317 [Thermocarpiscus australiensis]